jgi:hypothetical protein
MRAGESSVSMIVLIADHAVLLIRSNQVVKVSDSVLTMQFIHCKCTEGHAGS